jgi:ribonucleoside-diphosphate reductase alpha chain
LQSLRYHVRIVISTGGGALAAAAEKPASLPPYSDAEHLHQTTPPQAGIAPDLAAHSGLTTPNPYSLIPNPSSIEDRGIYHAADAMKSMYDMGDAPSCATCGAIMTRSGSCYRCMSCGNTSGCS